MNQSDENAAFAKRLRVARAWAGYSRQEEFGAALVERWPDWPVKSVVKRIENGLKDVGLDERALWAERLEEFAGVPKWFMLNGWEGAEQAGDIATQLDEIRATVERHDEMMRLLQPIRDRPAPFADEQTPADQAATTLQRAAEEARQQQDERPARKPATRKRKQG